MQISVESNQIIHSRGKIPPCFSVFETREIGDLIVIVYDYMAFPRNEPSRILIAYSGLMGKELWRADDIGAGDTDGYTDVISESPLIVGNFAGFDCHIDIQTGKVVSKVFTK